MLTACVTASTTTTAEAAPGSPAPPPLGWNSWNSFGCGVDESKVRQAADAMVSSGMKAPVS